MPPNHRDLAARCGRGPLDGRAHAVDGATDDRRIEDPFVLFEGSRAC